MRKILPVIGILMANLAVGACGSDAENIPGEKLPLGGTAVAVTDTTIVDAFEAAGTADPVRAATLSTKLMGSVIAVPVYEGDRVAAGTLLVRLDARDLDAKRAQVEAGLAEASAVYSDATVQTGRIRALYADSAATKAQLDQAETGLARATAAVASARAMAAELAATASYAEVRAPFAGVVTHRFVDPGSFAAPGAPLVTVEDASTLRVTVSAAPDAIRGLKAGTTVTAIIGDVTVDAKVEGVVPSGPNLYTVNALVPNAKGEFLSGSSATLALPRGTRQAILVPNGAVVRQGDLTGVRALSDGQPTLRWVKLGRSADGMTEVFSGLAAGDTVVVAGGER
ncbi:MAG TPA: efflux RND transporter periplasmic adaptor subunit [Gemmatimonadales bacterium]|nr:efflux RND transporter periplasmic adaptor subunit [Gemmatimonadales bacterium]